MASSLLTLLASKAASSSLQAEFQDLNERLSTAYNDLVAAVNVTQVPPALRIKNKSIIIKTND